MDHSCLSGTRGWDILPDPLLVLIFKRLEVVDVLSCSEVCNNWHGICYDNLLWKHLFKRDFSRRKYQRNQRNKEFQLRCGAVSWQEEYIRLTDQFPCVRKQTLKGHKDEVLHVAFSHDGSEIASCSKDHRVIVWRTDENDEFKPHVDIDMGMYQWLHTWAAQYSPSDTKLMVAGVVNEMGGEVAIFSTVDKYRLLCRLLNDPYDVMGCWCSDNYFISGTMEWNFNSFDASIWLCSPPTFTNKKTPLNKNSKTNLKEGSSSANSSLESDIVEDSSSISRIISPHSSPESEFNGEEEIHSDHSVVVSWYKKQLLKFRNLQGTIYVRYVQSHSRKQFNPESVSWKNSDEIKLRSSLSEDDNDEDGNGGMMIDELGIDSDVSFEIETGSEGMTEADESYFADQEMCIIFICGDKTSVPHQVGFHRITSHSLKSTPNITEPEKVLEMNGHVIGMTISPTKDFLYVNVRSWPDNAVPTQAQAPPINENIELKIINLKTLELEKKVLSGHKGFTPTEKAFYLYLDVSNDFVASGSEDSNGCIWEKHYGVLLTRLAHTECVNCVVFNPKDQETCITASDDHTLQVWTSRRKERLRNVTS